jgi:glutamine synthetase
MTARQKAIEAISTSKVASSQNYLEHAGEDIYGQYVFSESAQRQFLAKSVFKKLRRTIEGLEPFDPAIADAVAQGVKDWAIENGATHYTHWFQPLTGLTAEKHDSLISPDGQGGVIFNFSGDELVQGEPDASSVPLGRHPRHLRGPRLHRLGRHQPGLPAGRAQRHVTLTIPTAFVSWTGEALDHQDPAPALAWKRWAQQACASSAGSATAMAPPGCSPRSDRSRSTS